MKLAPSPRVLIVRLGAIGDVVNALVVANGLRQHRPDAHIGWASHPLSAPLVDGHPAVDDVHILPRGGGRPTWRAFLGSIREKQYDIALDLQRLQKSAWIARRSGAARVVGFDRARCKEFSWVWTKERIEPGPKREHMVLQYQRFLARLGVPESPPLRDLGQDSASETWADGWLREAGLDRAPILLNLGASKPEKRWPKESFLEVAELLLARAEAPPLVLTGGPGDLDESRWIMEGLASKRPDLVHGLRNSVSQTTLPQLVALIRRSALMVTGDTGAMHMAAAVGVRTVALFGPSDPVRTGPFGEGHVVLHGDRWLPRAGSVSLNEPRASIPMRGISAAAVAAAVGART